MVLGNTGCYHIFFEPNLTKGYNKKDPIECTIKAPEVSYVTSTRKIASKSHATKFFRFSEEYEKRGNLEQINSIWFNPDQLTDKLLNNKRRGTSDIRKLFQFLVLYEFSIENRQELILSFDGLSVFTLIEKKLAISLHFGRTRSSQNNLSYS